jgi:hypothetical protein
MTTQMRVLDRTDDDSDWTVIVDDTEHSVNGWASLCQLRAKFPDAECRVSGVKESALRKADIQRAMAQFKANGGRSWTSGG